MKMMRRFSVWLCAAVVLTGAGALRAKDPAIDPEKPPTLTGESKDPILLRYKMKKDQVLKMVMDLESTMQMKQGAQEMKIVQNMKMDAKMVVTEVADNGDISVITKITRLQMTVAAAGRTIEYDSDAPDDAPAAFKGVTAMMNVGVPCKITPAGKFLETDLDPLRLAAKRAGDAGLAKTIEDGAKKMFEETFMQLSEKPITAGETYKAGTMVNDKAKVKMSYKIGAVSGDGGTAILEPDATIEIPEDAFPGGTAKVKSQDVKGWFIFDVKNGLPGDGGAKIHFVMDVEIGGEAGSLDMTAISRVKVTSN